MVVGNEPFWHTCASSSLFTTTNSLCCYQALLFFLWCASFLYYLSFFHIYTLPNKLVSNIYHLYILILQTESTTNSAKQNQGESFFLETMCWFKYNLYNLMFRYFAVLNWLLINIFRMILLIFFQKVHTFK